MKLESSKVTRLAVVCAECEGRSDGPRHLDSKSASKELRRLGSDASVRVRIVRTRCLGLCPRRALAAMALGELLPAVTAEMQDDNDLRVLALYIFGPTARG